MTVLRSVVILIALASQPSAVRLFEHVGGNPDKEERGVSSMRNPDAQFYRQKLTNFGELQYVGHLSVGGQDITGILDTGSFEILVFGRKCKGCGIASAYDDRTSSTYEQSNKTKRHAFGSGTCFSEGVSDEISFGPLKSKRQNIWEVVNAVMPILSQAKFNAIIGIGPPGGFEGAGAKRIKPKSGEQALVAPEKKAPTPPNPEQGHNPAAFEEKGSNGDKINETQVSPNPDNSFRTNNFLLANFNVNVFSACLQKEKGEPGWIIYNDKDPNDNPSAFTKLKVTGEITWGLEMSEVQFKGNGVKPGEAVLGCGKGCGAILDTGTSLIGVPSDVYSKAIEVVSGLESDCSNLYEMPDLHVKLNGIEFALPPEAYIGEVIGDISKDVMKLMGSNRLLQEARDKRDLASTGAKMNHGPYKCHLLLMDLGMTNTQFGPMWILGMPWFREFYTTFDLGPGPSETNEHRAMFISAHDKDCYPSRSNADGGTGESAIGPQILRGVESKPQHRVVNASEVRVPYWLFDKVKKGTMII